MTYAKIKAKQRFLENLFRETKNLSDTWKRINKQKTKKPSSAMPQAIIINGKTITSSHQIGNEMNIHFV